MIERRSLGFFRTLKMSWFHFIWLLAFSGIVAALYDFKILDFVIPWLPTSVIGTAVAFFVGFKNNQAYDRMWEARKIWGAIVNSSRAWGMQVDGYITNNFKEDKLSEEELASIKKKLIYRHIAWLYVLRNQLLQTTPWEHINQRGGIRKVAQLYRDKYGIGLVVDEVTEASLDKYLSEEEYERLLKHKNTATQIINEQSRNLRDLRETLIIDDFRHMDMSKTLYDFYVHQGKAERIKKFPLPRQYANLSRVFVGIFIFFLPFSMMPELLKVGELALWLSVPITALIGWVYIMMELVGDYSENPFQGMANDIPMLALSRTIEIDLREMLGETELPPAIKSKRGILM